MNVSSARSKTMSFADRAEPARVAFEFGSGGRVETTRQRDGDGIRAAQVLNVNVECHIGLCCGCWLFLTKKGIRHRETSRRVRRNTFLPASCR